jgi:hypothetical protein
MRDLLNIWLSLLCALAESVVQGADWEAKGRGNFSGSMRIIL